MMYSMCMCALCWKKFEETVAMERSLKNESYALRMSVDSSSDKKHTQILRCTLSSTFLIGPTQLADKANLPISAFLYSRFPLISSYVDVSDILWGLLSTRTYPSRPNHFLPVWVSFFLYLFRFLLPLGLLGFTVSYGLIRTLCALSAMQTFQDMVFLIHPIITAAQRRKGIAKAHKAETSEVIKMQLFIAFFFFFFLNHRASV